MSYAYSPLGSNKRRKLSSPKSYGARTRSPSAWNHFVKQHYHTVTHLAQNKRLGALAQKARAAGVIGNSPKSGSKKPRSSCATGNVKKRPCDTSRCQEYTTRNGTYCRTPSKIGKSPSALSRRSKFYGDIGSLFM